jgi:hypothetical protein
MIINDDFIPHSARKHQTGSISTARITGGSIAIIDVTTIVNAGIESIRIPRERQ